MVAQPAVAKQEAGAKASGKGFRLINLIVHELVYLHALYAKSALSAGQNFRRKIQQPGDSHEVCTLCTSMKSVCTKKYTGMNGLVLPYTSIY
jgi:hypothetical protein